MDQPTKDPADTGGELRRNPISGKLVIVAPGRAARPQDGAARPRGSAASASASRPSPPAACPFCEGNEALTPPEIEAHRPAGGAPDSPGWTLRVVPNKYPALAGRHEVIVWSPDHGADLEDLAPEALTAFVASAQRRIAAQLADGAVTATLVVNRGLGSGASLEHPHAQLFATPLVPSLLQDELMEFERHRNRYGTCVLCDEVQNAGERLVFDGDYVAWIPAAPRFAYEPWLAPAPRRRRHHGRPGATRRGPAARPGRGQDRDRRRALQPLAPHGPPEPRRPLPLARRDRAAPLRSLASSSPATSPSSASTPSRRRGASRRGLRAGRLTRERRARFRPCGTIAVTARRREAVPPTETDDARTPIVQITRLVSAALLTVVLGGTTAALAPAATARLPAPPRPHAHSQRRREPGKKHSTARPSASPTPRLRRPHALADARRRSPTRRSRPASSRASRRNPVSRASTSASS